MATKLMLLENARETGAGKRHTPTYGFGSTYQAIGSVTEGTGSVVVDVEVSNDKDGPFLALGSITLALSPVSVADGFASTAPWVYVSGNVKSISGTGAKVSLVMGV